ncbi:hypothetical protein EMIT0347P_150019 [Pseudomonas sp. IT-347P]
MPCVAVVTITVSEPAPPVGVSLLAIAVCLARTYRLTHRYREQAHSYRVCLSGQRSNVFTQALRSADRR